MSFRLTNKVHLWCLVLSVIITVLLYPIFIGGLESLILSDYILSPTKSIMINYYIIIFLMIAFVTILHEGIHGAFYILFGGKVKFGVKKLCVYTQEISGIPINKLKFLIVLLSPAIIISLLSFIMPYSIGMSILVFNLVGCSGDFYMSFYIMRLPKKCSIVDRSYGFDIVKDI